MKCENCGRSFIIVEYNKLRECPDCGQAHEIVVTGEPNMIKKLWKKFVSWLFSWQK